MSNVSRADEMAQPLHRLRRADQPAGAAAHRIGLAGPLVARARRRLPHTRAVGRELVGLRAARPALR